MNYQKVKDWTSGFHDWAIRRHPHGSHIQNGFMGGFIFGERGQGKSTYIYKLMAKIYYTLLGYSLNEQEESAYDTALNYIIFEPKDFIALTTTNSIKHIVTPVICLDDASMHFGNMLHMTDNKMYSALLAETATIRSVVTAMLITAPKRIHVAKFLRDYDDYKGEAFVDSGGENYQYCNWNRYIRFYRWKYYPDEVKYKIHIPFQDKYSCYIPDIPYKKYIMKKGFFEIKHKIDIADKLIKDNRDMIIGMKNELPSYPNQPDLKLIVEKWEKEEREKGAQREKSEIQRRMDDANFVFRTKKFKEKIDKLTELGDEL